MSRVNWNFSIGLIPIVVPLVLVKVFVLKFVYYSLLSYSPKPFFIVCFYF